MGEILSQDEVDALLKAVEDGGVPPADGDPTGATGPRSVRSLDLTNLQWSVEARLPGLRPLADRFAHGLRGSLGQFFGQLPRVAPRAIQLVKLRPFLGGLAGPLCLQLFRLAPLRGQGLLVLPPTLVGALLQVFFGGNPSRKTAAPSRDFSAIELRVLERLGTRVLQDLRDSWSPVAPVECSLVRSETNPRFVSLGGPHDVVLVIEVGVSVEGCEDGNLLVCIPNASLDPIRPRLQGPSDTVEEAPDPAWRERLHAALAQAAVEVSAELGTQRLTMREVLAMKPGDVIPLGTGREGPVVMKVEGRARFVGAPGVSGGHNAIRVTATL